MTHYISSRRLSISWHPLFNHCSNLKTICYPARSSTLKLCPILAPCNRLWATIFIRGLCWYARNKKKPYQKAQPMFSKYVKSTTLQWCFDRQQKVRGRTKEYSQEDGIFLCPAKYICSFYERVCAWPHTEHFSILRVSNSAPYSVSLLTGFLICGSYFRPHVSLVLPVNLITTT